MLFWLILAYFVADLSEYWGIPPRFVMAAKCVVSLLLLLLALGVFGRAS